MDAFLYDDTQWGFHPPDIGLPGTGGTKNVSRVNGASASRKRMRITFAGTWANGAVVSVAIQGITVASYTVAGSPTLAQIRDIVFDRIASNWYARNVVIAAKAGSAAAPLIDVTWRKLGEDFTLATTEDAAGSAAVTTVDAVTSLAYIEAGAAVILSTGTHPKGVAMPSGSAGTFLGVALMDQVHSSFFTNSRQALYKPGDPLPVALEGPVIVIPEVAVTAGQAVFYRHVTNGLLTPGYRGWRNDDGDTGGGATATAATGWTFGHSASAGQPVEILK